MALPVILDVDTGVDDACALLLAALHPALDLRAVTCVGGNAPLPDVVRNTCSVLATAGRMDVPVAAGADRPLGTQAPDPRHAIELLRDQLAAAAASGERITLIPLAPLTTIALLLRTYPEAARGIERIVFMGGAAASGNATASAEFNIFHDPEAAAIVFDATADLAIPMTMYGLDVFYRPRITRAEAQLLRALDPTGPAGLGGRLISFQCDRFGADDATIGDAGAVCAVIDPSGLTTTPLPARVELSGRYTRGRTIVDHRDWSGDLAHDPHGQSEVVLDVALGVDAPAYAALWLDTLRTTGKRG